LAAAIAQALDDEGRSERMGRGGRERMVNLFSWRSVAERTVEVYRELIS